VRVFYLNSRKNNEKSSSNIYSSGTYCWVGVSWRYVNVWLH
jgi:hypothetical protein